MNSWADITKEVLKEYNMETHKQKYNLGDEVDISFIGRIKKVEIDTNCISGKESVMYRVDGKHSSGWVMEDDMFPLPTPENMGGSHERLHT